MIRPLTLSILVLALPAGAAAPPIALAARFRGDTLEFRTRSVEPDAIADCLFRIAVESVAPGGGRGPTVWELDAGSTGACLHLPTVFGRTPKGMERLGSDAAPRLRPGIVYRVFGKGKSNYDGRFRIDRSGRHLHIVDLD